MPRLRDIARVYLYRDPVDFRKSINGPSQIVESDMAGDLFDGSLYLFCNRGRDKIKILYWDTTGFCLWYKRLEKHSYPWPRRLEGSELEISEVQLQGLLAGHDILEKPGHTPLNYHTMHGII